MMRKLQSFRVGLWAVVILNMLMAFGSIWIFMRMAPAIEVIIYKNERSLQACEQMLSAVILSDKAMFDQALDAALNNITETGEPEALDMIKSSYIMALQGDEQAQKETVEAVGVLSGINRQAMARADYNAKQIGSAGAWGIVFMGTVLFLTCMILVRYYRANISGVLEEINDVLSENKAGNRHRRCFGDSTDGAHFIYSEINGLLDKSSEKN